MMSLASGPLLSVWIGAPLGVVTLALVAAHVALLSRAREMPDSRRRIRRVNGWLMLGTVPIAVYAFCIASPATPRSFALSWMAVLGLVSIVLMLACLDILNTLRLHRAEQREIRRGLAEAFSRRAALTGSALTRAGVPGRADHGDQRDQQ